MKSTWLIIWSLVLFCGQSFATFDAHMIDLDHLDDPDFQDDLPASYEKAAVQLLVDKRLLNKILVESMDIVVQYHIYNIGHETARNIRLQDPSFDDVAKFSVVGGLTDASFGSLPPGMNFSHTVVVRPLQHGPFEFKAAEITYLWGEDVTSFATSSEPGKLMIHSTSSFNRQFSPHFEEWAAFAILCMPSLLVPYMLWFSTKSKSENLIKESGGVRKRQMYCYRDR